MIPGKFEITKQFPLKSFVSILLTILFYSDSRAQVCLGASDIKTGSGFINWLEYYGDNRIIAGAQYYTYMVFDNDTLFPEPGNVVSTAVIITDSAFNLVRMFNGIGFSNAGGAFNDTRIFNMTVDNHCNIYFTGSYVQDTLIYGTDTVYSDHYEEGFLARCDSMGNALLLKSFGSRTASTNYTYEDQGRGVGVDHLGNIYVTGFFEGSYFQINSDTVNNGINVGLNSYAQSFVFSLNPSGQTNWVRAFGAATPDDTPLGITVDNAGNSVVVGQTSASNHDFYFGNFTYHYKLSQLGYQGYAGKLDASGTPLWFYPFETYVGTGPDIVPTDVDMDANGNAYVTGWFDYYGVFNQDTVTTSNSTSAFLVKINSNGQSDFIRFGKTETFYPFPASLDVRDDKVLICGQSFTNGLNFDHYGLCCSMEAYYAMYDTSGQIQWLKGLSTASAASGYALDVTISPSGKGYAAGGANGGAITIEPQSWNAAADYYMIKFDSIPSNSLTANLVNLGNDTVNCGSLAQLQMQANPSSPTRYFWYADNDTIPGPFYNANLNGSPKMTTTYYANAYLGGCVVLDSVTVYVEPISVSAGQDTFVCSGFALQLNGNVIPNATYNWLPSNAVSNDTIPDPFLNTGQGGQLIYTVNLNGCINSDTVTVIEIINPVANYTLGGSGTTVQFFNSSVNYQNFLWDFGDGTLDSLNVNPLHIYPSLTYYTACLYVMNECASDSFCFTLNLAGIGFDEQDINPDYEMQNTSEIISIAELKSGWLKTVFVYDLNGKEIAGFRNVSGEVKLDKSLLANGMYILKINRNAFEKFLVTH